MAIKNIRGIVVRIILMVFEGKPYCFNRMYTVRKEKCESPILTGECNFIG